MSDTNDTLKMHEEDKKKFLTFLGDEVIAGNVKAAAKACGRSRNYFYELRKNDSAFGSAWDKIRDEALDNLADFAESQLFTKVKEGNIVAIIFTLKNLRPERWKERRELETPRDKPLEVSMPGLVDALRSKYPDAADILSHGTSNPTSTAVAN